MSVTNLSLDDRSQDFDIPLCQSCFNPIEINDNFYDIDEIDKKIISDAINPDSDCKDEKLPPLTRQTISSVNNDPDDYSLSLSNRFIINSYLFDLLSEKTPFEHPLCQNCSDAILQAMEKQVMFKNDELKCINDYYQDLLKNENCKSDEEKWSDDFEEEKSITSIREIDPDDSDDISDFLEKSISHLKKECEDLEAEIFNENAELRKKEKELEKIKKEYNNSRILLLDSESEIFSLELKLQTLNFHHEKLKNSNILKMTFPISTDQPIGTISGLQLGRLPTKPTEWSEINAAWGQCALLANLLARKINYTFTNYTIVYHADQSRMHHNETDKDFVLANTAGIRIFSGHNFDTAMIAFLECLSELQNKISNVMKMPYLVFNRQFLKHEDGSLYSIKYSRKSEEEWTKALLRMLSILKWMVIICSVNDKKQ